VIDERDEPEMDRVRDALREHDQRVEEDEAAGGHDDEGEDREEPEDTEAE
jgi:hypothetical protein